MTTPLREQAANEAESLLDGGIDNSVTSLDVDSAASFPSAGNFRIRIDDEIMTVTAVSTNTFTVVRGQDGTAAASHSDDAPVTHLFTADSYDRTGKDNLPNWGGAFPPLNKLVADDGTTLLTASDFTWVNQGGASVTDQHGTIALRVPSASSENNRLLTRSAPSAPYVYTTAFQFMGYRSGAGGSVPHFGIGIRESSTGKFTIMMALCDGTSGWRLQVSHWTDATTFSSSPVGRDNFTVIGPQLWMRVEDNNTNHKFYLSADGIEWIEVASFSRTTFMTTPNQVLFYGANANTTTGADQVTRLVHWSRTS